MPRALCSIMDGGLFCVVATSLVDEGQILTLDPLMVSPSDFCFWRVERERAGGRYQVHCEIILIFPLSRG